MKELKDYLFLYLGCEMVCHKDFIPNSRERSARGKGFCILTPDLLSDIDRNRLEYGTPHFKPILRPLSYELFVKHGFAFFETPTWMQQVEAWSNCINKMRLDGIDCDGLIEAGLAIDKTTLK